MTYKFHAIQVHQGCNKAIITLPLYQSCRGPLMPRVYKNRRSLFACVNKRFIVVINCPQKHLEQDWLRYIPFITVTNLLCSFTTEKFRHKTLPHINTEISDLLLAFSLRKFKPQIPAANLLYHRKTSEHYHQKLVFYLIEICLIYSGFYATRDVTFLPHVGRPANVSLHYFCLGFRWVFLRA